MSGGIDRLRARATLAAGTAAPVARDDGAFASMLAPRQAPAEAAEAAPAAPASGLAWVQANVADIFARTAQDRQARQHGRALLKALACLQRAALLGDGAMAHEALAALAATAADQHEADDPVLRLILREIAVRASVELARAELPSLAGHVPAPPRAGQHVSNA